MSEPEELHAEEIGKETSVHELPPLPVEFPPRDDEGEILIGEQPRRSVTFDVGEGEVNLPYSCPEGKAENHGNIKRSISADGVPTALSASKELRRRSKSVIKIRQAPSYFLAGIESSELRNKRTAFASKRSSTKKLVDDKLALPSDDTNDGKQKTDRRGSFFQTVEQQLAMKRHNSLSPQASREKLYVSPFVQMLCSLRDAKNLCSRLQEECSSQPDQGTGDSSIGLDTKEKVEGLSLEIEENLDWCIDLLQSINSKKTAGQMAQEQFQMFLRQQSRHSSTHELAFWVAQTITDKENKVDNAVLMDPPSSGKLVKTASFTDDGTLFGVSVMDEYNVIEFFDAQIDLWGMDVFHLNDLTSGHPLVATACAIFRKRDLWNAFKLHKTKFIRYMTEIESQYHNANAYHNAMHAADVMQSTHYLLNFATFEGSFMPLEIVSLLVAAAIHDVDHPGKTNDFLVATSDNLAILYHDRSVLENHHLAVAIRTLTKPECNFLSALDASQFEAFKDIVVDMVLATDMALHYEHVGNMKSMLESKMATSKEIVLDAYNDRVEVMKYMMHCADLSGPAKPLHLCTKWTYRVMEEFFIQGDEEKRLGLPVSAIMDRDTVVISKTQTGFLEYFVYPLFELLTDLVYPFGDFILENLTNNKSYWASLEDQPGLVESILHVPSAKPEASPDTKSPKNDH